ncbi:signal recognition particle 9 kDa protein-domain-containing protein [Hypoxylon crocopeplum]|nr:signal recognition particle 9 kDa protein-domain-containing protein [Hypoxylon crocopeplum]
MPYYATSQEWLRQSSLLIEARPSTTRITTKYHITSGKRRRSKSASASVPSPETETTSAVPRGSLTLKTYDPQSGVCLKYRTTKAAEVSRLILSLGQPLGARMAALPSLPEGEEDEVMVDAPAAAAAPTTTTEDGGKKKNKKTEEVARAPTPVVASSSGGGGGGGGGGKGKKKRGKK